MKCIIYLRVSTKEQALTNEKEGYSIAAQRKACIRYAEEKGWEVVDEYVDRGESARSAHRPQLQLMLSYIKKEKGIDFVIVHKIDRLARNLEDHVAIKAILTKAECSLVSVVENIEDTASGKLVEGIHAIVAEFYSANLAAEVTKGMFEKAKEGGWNHKAPAGYKNIRQEIPGAKRGIAKVVIDPEKSPHVKEAFKLYATGNYSLEEMREFLFNKGITNHKGNDLMSLNGVHKLLRNPFYTGVVTYKGIEYPGQHEPLVTRELFQKVQDMIKVRDIAGERKRKHPHYLKGTLFCAECGSRLSVDKAKGKYTYFYCLGQKKRKTCSQPYVEAEILEKAVEKEYEEIQLTQQAADKLVERFNNEIISGQSTNAMEEEFLRKRMAKLASERVKLMKAYYSGAVPLEVLKGEQERITNDVATSEARLKQITIQGDQHAVVLNKAIKMALTCGMGYKKATHSTKRLFNQAFFEKIYVKDKKLYKGEFTDLFGALFSKSSNKTDLVDLIGFEPSWLGLNGLHHPTAFPQAHQATTSSNTATTICAIEPAVFPFATPVTPPQRVPRPQIPAIAAARYQYHMTPPFSFSKSRTDLTPSAQWNIQSPAEFTRLIYPIKFSKHPS